MDKRGLFERVMGMMPDEVLRHSTAKGTFHIVREQFFYRVWQVNVEPAQMMRFPQRHGSYRLERDVLKRRDVAALLACMGEAAPELAYPQVARFGRRWVGFQPRTYRALVYADTPAEAQEAVDVEREVERALWGRRKARR